MKERPIIFSGESVRAILDGRKKQTRRVVFANSRTNKGFDFAIARIEAALGKEKYFFAYPPKGTVGKQVICPYGRPGDRLWVRESFYPTTTREFGRGQVVYKADTLVATIDGEPIRWQPSIHMPRWASRITLEIVNVRVERLKEITVADVVAEGAFPEYELYKGGWLTSGLALGTTPGTAFHNLWDSINGKRAPWSSNPWVWIIEFKRV